jgi:methylated-DNA-[protein]-cysteine S-methyltransferase
MIVAKLLKDPPVVGTWVVRSPLATLLVRASQHGITEIKFVSDAVAAKEEAHAQERDALGWMPEFLDRLEAYLRGERVSFDEFPIDLRKQPPFRRKVQEACRRIAYGKTLTYSQLAARVGNPAAGRAVGSAMSHNPIPIVIPCHRVVRGDGGLGGFSAPGGMSLKEKLLEMEKASR